MKDNVYADKVTLFSIYSHIRRKDNVCGRLL